MDFSDSSSVIECDWDVAASSCSCGRHDQAADGLCQTGNIAESDEKLGLGGCFAIAAETTLAVAFCIAVHWAALHGWR